MKLLMVTTYATPTNMRRELLEAVRSRGHEVVVAAPEPKQLMEPALRAIGGTYREWNVDRTAISPRADLRAAAHLYRIVRDERPDVLLAYQIKTVLISPVMAKLARVPHVVALINGLGSVFDVNGFGRTTTARVARSVYGLALRAVDTIVFQNPDDPALLAASRLLSPNARWQVVAGSGVDTRVFTPVIRRPTRTFTLVSRLLVSKGVRDLVAAARIVRDRFPDARFRLVGPLEAATHPDAITRAEIEEWERAGLVEYTGFTEDIRGVLADTTVFVLPSYYREGVPRTNLEALAVGLPIVTTDSVGCRETVRDGVNGFLIQPRDPGVLAARLLRYLEEPSLVEEHGRASRELAERRFDVRLVNDEMLRALRL